MINPHEYEYKNLEQMWLWERSEKQKQINVIIYNYDSIFFYNQVRNKK
jgi:hypothetical protein